MTDIIDVALLKLRLDGQRFTVGRQYILRALSELVGPVTIPMLLDHQPKLAQSSVYRNLAVLEHAGLVSKIALGDDHAHYELGEALTKHHHHHFVCTSCGRVEDVTLADSVERALDKALQSAADEVSFTLHHHRLDLVGLCARCTSGATKLRRSVK